jgi:hypothetical protein
MFVAGKLRSCISFTRDALRYHPGEKLPSSPEALLTQLHSVQEALSASVPPSGGTRIETVAGPRGRKASPLSQRSPFGGNED